VALRSRSPGRGGPASRLRRFGGKPRCTGFAAGPRRTDPPPSSRACSRGPLVHASQLFHPQVAIGDARPRRAAPAGAVVSAAASAGRTRRRGRPRLARRGESRREEAALNGVTAASPPGSRRAPAATSPAALPHPARRTAASAMARALHRVAAAVMGCQVGTSRATRQRAGTARGRPMVAPARGAARGRRSCLRPARCLRAGARPSAPRPASSTPPRRLWHTPTVCSRGADDALDQRGEARHGIAAAAVEGLAAEQRPEDRERGRVAADGLEVELDVALRTGVAGRR